MFFPLPDGNGLLYNLVGTATEPKVAARFTKEVPCKTNAVEMLPVTNWLKKPQRYVYKTLRDSSFLILHKDIDVSTKAHELAHTMWQSFYSVSYILSDSESKLKR